MQYYVSTSGSDTNNGLSSSTPKKTLAAVCALATSAGDIVYLKGGDTFREVLTPIASGNSTSPITFKSYGIGNATISACEFVTSPWTLQGNVYQTTISASWNLGINKNQVFSSSNFLAPPVWPPSDVPFFSRRLTDYGVSTGGSSDLTQDANGMVTGVYQCPGIVGDWSGKKINFYPGLGWGIQYGDIISNTSTQVTFKFPYRSFRDSYIPTSGNYFYLWGRVTDLRPGEALIEGTTLYVYPKVPGTPTNIEVKARTNTAFLDSKSYINIEGINFFAGNVRARNGSYLQFTNCRFDYPTFEHGGGPYAIDAQASPYTSISDCDFSYTFGTCIFLSGNNSKCINSTICDTLYGYGIYASNPGASITVSNNTIVNTGSHGININSPACVCSGNRVVNVGARAIDIAGINVAGVSLAVGQGDLQGTKVTNNLSHDHTAIYDSSKSYWGSSCIRCDSGFPEGVSNVLIDTNICWNASNASIAVWGLSSGQTNYQNAQIKVINNTCHGPINLVSGTDISQQGLSIHNNISASIQSYQASALITNNLFAYTSLASNLTGDPLLQNMDALDFRLTASSPCRGSGLTTYPPMNADMGAIPYGSQPIRAGASPKATDMGGLVFTTDYQNGYVKVTGFAKARGLGKDTSFALKVGQSYYTNDSLYDSIDPLTGEVTAYVKFPTYIGTNPIAITVNGGSTFTLTSGVYTGSSGTNTTPDNRLSIATASVAGQTLNISGYGFYNIPTGKVPVNLKTLNGTSLGYGSSQPIILDAPTGTPFSLRDSTGTEVPYALDGNIVWIKPTPVQYPKQDYFASSRYYIQYESSYTPLPITSYFPLLSGSKLWLRAHDIDSPNNTPVSSWWGVNFWWGPANFAIQTSSTSKMPVLKTNIQNGYAALKFDGVDDYMEVGLDLGNPASATLFGAYQNPTPGTNTFQRLISTSTEGTVDSTVGVTLTTARSTFNYPDAYPGGNVVSVTATNKDITNIHIGARHSTLGNLFTGYLLELLIIEGVLTSTQINSISKDYLKVKYGIPPYSKSTLNQSAAQSPLILKVNGATTPITSLASGSISANLSTPITYPALVELTSVDGQTVSYTIPSLFSPYKIGYIFTPF